MIDLIVLIMGVLLSASIGLFVYARNTKSIVNKLYGFLTLLFILYPIANYLSLQTTDRLFYIRAVIFCTTLAVACLYYLVFFLGGHRERLRRLQRLGVYFTVIVASLDWTPLVFKGLSGGTNPTPIPSALSAIFLIHLVTFLAASLLLLMRSVRSSRGAVRLQYIYMLIGIAPIFFLAPITAFVLPVVFKNPNFVFLSPVYALFFVALIGYAIVKHQLFDIRFFAIRAGAYLSTLFVITVVAILPIALIFNFLFDLNLRGGRLAVFVLGSVVVLYFLQYVRRLFDKITNRIFFRNYYDTQDILGRLGDVLVRTADVTALCSETGSILGDALKPLSLRYVLFAGSKDDAALARRVSAQRKANDYEIIDADELSRSGRELAELLKSEGIALTVRLQTKHEDLGYLVVGHKRSGEVYTDRDKQLLLVSAGEIAIGLQNALRFQEIEKFNLTLQQKIDDATKKLRKTNERLRLLDQTKDDFISMASHQLRTPLTSIKGYVSMTLDGDAGKLNTGQEKMLTQAFLSAQRMVYLISDLLNVSRLKTGKFVIESVESNLAKVIEEELEQLTETVKSRNLELVYHKPEHFPTLMMDETKIRQVIMNFVDNAIYYTPNGGRIEVHLADKSESIEFTVVDNGIGVPKHEQHHLFSKFYRAKNAQSARPDGTGLGLFMAKKVVIAQGGAIIFRSAEGKGSTFGFIFPKTALTAKAEPPKPEPASKTS